ncbi:MAG: ATP phosphoribosyltransferase regulatory subunit [Candidatus Methanosuratincola sp.]|nr:ATP phosphoribosyltransferase regulatory subunit [Candidatus Methanosuratincola sp.]
MGPEEVRVYLLIEGKFREVLRKWGYKEVRTSTLDYFDIIRGGAGEGFTDSIFKVQDYDGRLLSLRGEVTTQIARMLASKAKDEGRLCYITNCIRYLESRNLSLREYWQAGAELIGGERVGADAEAVALALDMLDSIGIRASVDLGSMGVIRKLMERYRIMDYKRLARAIASKSIDDLRKVTCDSKALETFTMLMTKRGGAELIGEVAEKAGCLGEDYEYFRSLYRALEAYGCASRVFVDLSTIREMAYYNGLVFEIFTPALGLPIGGGGRYDAMMKDFGIDTKATGFALSIDLCAKALGGSDVKKNNDTLKVYYREGFREKAIGLARILRGEGKCCTLDAYRGERSGILVGERTVLIESGEEYEP